MANDNWPPWPLNLLPQYAQVFADGYPTGRGAPAPATGWECPGCGRCWAPQVLSCHYCPGTVVINKADSPVMGDWGQDEQ